MLLWHLDALPRGNTHVVAWMASLRRMPPSWDPSCMDLGGVSALAALAQVPLCVS